MARLWGRARARARVLYLSRFYFFAFQGGYLYALYAEYGYSMHQIALIFVVCCR